MSCRAFATLLAEAALAPRGAALSPALAEHLDRCAACSAELAELRAVAALVGDAGPAAGPPQAVWTRLAPALDAIDAERERRWRLLPSIPLRVAAAAALVAVAIATSVLLRSGPSGPPPPRVPATGALDERLDAYLQRATPLVVALANRSEDDEAGAFDAVSERRVARDLAREGRALGAALRDARRGGETALVDDLVVVFMQLGNSPSGRYAASVALARHGIERRDLLFTLAVREVRRTTSRPVPMGTPPEERT